jgi:hypothetical protein
MQIINKDHKYVFERFGALLHDHASLPAMNSIKSGQIIVSKLNIIVKIECGDNNSKYESPATLQPYESYKSSSPKLHLPQLPL